MQRIRVPGHLGVNSRRPRHPRALDDKELFVIEGSSRTSRDKRDDPRANADTNLSDLYATLDRNKSTVSSHTSEITTQATEETNQPENKREMRNRAQTPAKQTPRTRKRRADSSHNTHVTCRASTIRHWKNKKAPTHM